MFAPLVSIAHAASAEGGSGGMPQFDATHFPSQILWLAAAIVVLHFLLSKIALPRVNEIITTREQAIIGDVERAEELHKTAEELRNRIAEQRAATHAEAQRIAVAAREAVSREIEAELAEATARIAARTEAGERRVQALRSAISGSAGVEAEIGEEWEEPHREATLQVEQIAREVSTALVAKFQHRSPDAGVILEAVRNRTGAS